MRCVNKSPDKDRKTNTSFCFSYFAALRNFVEKEMLSDHQSSTVQTHPETGSGSKNKKIHQQDSDTRPLRVSQNIFCLFEPYPVRQPNIKYKQCQRQCRGPCLKMTIMPFHFPEKQSRAFAHFRRWWFYFLILTVTQDD